MPITPDVFAEVAQRFGSVDPRDDAAVERFYEDTFDTLAPQLQQRIAFELAARSGEPVDAAADSPEAIDALFVEAMRSAGDRETPVAEARPFGGGPARESGVLGAGRQDDKTE